MGTWNNIYDAEGARIGKGTLASAPGSYTATCTPPLGSGFTLTARYLVDLGGNQVTELSEQGLPTPQTEQWQHSNVWAAGKLTATYDYNYGHGGIHYELADPLGTKRVQANALGQTDEQCTSLPFGNDINNPPNLAGTSCTFVANSLSTADDATEHHFTQKERDTETGNDYFLARYYSSALGRFTTPDWSAKVVPVPYAQMDDPQSLNLYAYVRNNPLSRRDLDGHADIAAECKGHPTCTKTVVQTVEIWRHHPDGSIYLQSTLKVTTDFTLNTDAKGKVSGSAASTVEEVQGHSYNADKLKTMGKDIGTMQQAALFMGFGQNTTQMVTGIGAAESGLGGDPKPTWAAEKMNPATNPMQLVKGANMDLYHNIKGAMDVLNWAQTAMTGNASIGWDDYYWYSDRKEDTMSNFLNTYNSLTEVVQ